MSFESTMFDSKEARIASALENIFFCERLPVFLDNRRYLKDMDDRELLFLIGEPEVEILYDQRTPFVRNQAERKPGVEFVSHLYRPLQKKDMDVSGDHTTPEIRDVVRRLCHDFYKKYWFLL